MYKIHIKYNKIVTHRRRSVNRFAPETGLSAFTKILDSTVHIVRIIKKKKEKKKKKKNAIILAKYPVCVRRRAAANRIVRISRRCHDVPVCTIAPISLSRYGIIITNSRDRDTRRCVPTLDARRDPLITFHLSGAMSAIYARQASLTLLAPDE